MKRNLRFDILGPEGFVPFDGIIKRTKEACLITTSGGNITVSYDHRFIIGGEEVPVLTLKVGDYINTTDIITDVSHIDAIDLYDPVNVGKMHQYFGNGIIHHNCQFLGSSNTLISGNALARMSSIEPIHTVMGLDVHETPQDKHFYILVADTAQGVGGDYSAFTIVDVTDTPYKISAKYRNNNISPLLFPSVIHKAAVDYNNAFVLVETNDIGQGVVNVLYQEFEYENVFTTVTDKNQTHLSPGFAKSTTFGVRTTKTVKRQGCFSLKSMIEEQKLLIFDSDIISELSTFVEHNGLFSADEGYHDDLVMTLVLFGWLTTNQYFRDMTDINIRERMYQQQMLQIENEMTPFFVIDGSVGDTFVAGGDVWTHSE